MSLKNIKSNTQAQKGFTIVELLIVVVVIAILAAITIVSYNGITNRANASAAAATASTLQKKVELYSNDSTATTGYPVSIAALSNSADTSKSFYVPANTIKPVAAVTSTNGKDSVVFEVCGTPTGAAASKTVVTGVKITYYTWDTPTTKTTTVGDTSTTANCAVSAL